MKFVQNDPKDFERFLVNFQDPNTSQAERTWSAFKALLSTFTYPWSFKQAPLSKAGTAQRAEFNSLLTQGVLSASKWEHASLSVLTEAYSLAPRTQLGPSSLDPIHISSDGSTVEGPPKDFATRHPYAFREKFYALGADPETFEVVIDYLTGKPITLPDWVVST